MRGAGLPLARQPVARPRAHRLPEFLADPAMRAEAWRRKFAMDDLYAGARPGRGHRAVARWAASGLVGAVVTQNIDGLHGAAAGPGDEIVELHGNGTYRALPRLRRPPRARPHPRPLRGRRRAARMRLRRHRQIGQRRLRPAARPRRSAARRRRVARLRPVRRPRLDAAGAPGGALPRARAAERRAPRHRQPRADAARRRGRPRRPRRHRRRARPALTRRGPSTPTPRDGARAPQHTFHNLAGRGRVSTLTGIRRC